MLIVSDGWISGWMDIGIEGYREKWKSGEMDRDCWVSGLLGIGIDG